ncbi:MAG: fumarylacetoacetate hydrolase family protein [Bacteroidetes bacterium]|nr:fumarylacetoacetate hydrolase family protein [Bacteroidota bacterium]
MLDKNRISEILHNAATEAKAVSQMLDDAGFSVENAYEIQALSIEKRFIAGEKLVGYKLGFTSQAKMIQMGVHDMIWGVLTDRMNIPEGGVMSISNYIHPRVEPEIAIITAKKIDRPLQLAESRDYVKAIAPAMEIIDSRYKNFKFTLADVIADNCSSSGFIVGQWFSENIHINNLGTVLKINGNPVQIGSSNAVLGNPWEALPAISRLTHQYNKEIPEGSVILIGAITPAVALTKGDFVESEFQNLGKISFSVE